MAKKTIMDLGSYLKMLDDHPELIGDDHALLKLVKDEHVITLWQKKYQKELSQKGLSSKWGEIGVVLDDPYNMIIRDLVQFPDGKMHGYMRSVAVASLRGGKGVVIFPKFREKILLLHQYRHPTRRWHYQVPLGYGEPDIPSEENARKELEEETGGQISVLVSLGEFFANPGYESIAVSLFYAELSSVGSANINEGIESFVWVTIKELEEMIANEIITDSFTIAAYTKAKLKGLI